MDNPQGIAVIRYKQSRQYCCLGCQSLGAPVCVFTVYVLNFPNHQLNFSFIGLIISNLMVLGQNGMDKMVYGQNHRCKSVFYRKRVL